LWDVASGLNYLHSCEIVHGNLKGVSLLDLPSPFLCVQDMNTKSLKKGECSGRQTGSGPPHRFWANVHRPGGDYNACSSRPQDCRYDNVGGTGNLERRSREQGRGCLHIYNGGSRGACHSNEMFDGRPSTFRQTFTGHSPFVATYQAALYDIMSGKRPLRPETLSNDGLWELMQKGWDQDPGKRPTTLEMLGFFRTS
jgi:serine/threonine protein kinase